MSLLESVHADYIQQRRIEVLAGHLKPLIPPNSTVLDVGCGDGRLLYRIKQERMDLSFRGIDVLVRAENLIPVQHFDGETIPAEAASVDVVMFIDVLHHSNDPISLLREATRVTRRSVIIKDHMINGVLAEPTLKFMDRIGNARYGVALPGNYWHQSQWIEVFEKLALTPVDWQEKLALYPKALDLLFGRSLHFLAKLDIGKQPMAVCPSK
jgi:SAM-dependent methyltransferase